MIQTWCEIPCQLIHLKLGPVDTYVFNCPVTGGMGCMCRCANGFSLRRSTMFLSP